MPVILAYVTYSSSGRDPRGEGVVLDLLARKARGASSEAAAANILRDALGSAATIYRNAVFLDETGHGGVVDVDLLVVASGGVVPVGVTSTASGVFSRRGNRLTGHEGASRQVRQLSSSLRQLSASCVGRLTAVAGLPLFAVLALDGLIDEQLRRHATFDVCGSPPIPRAIEVVGLAHLGGYLRGRLEHHRAQPEVARSICRQLERHVISTRREADPAPTAYETKVSR